MPERPLLTIALDGGTPPPPTGAIGVNLAGLEFNPGAQPGRPGWDYAVPSTGELDYFRSRGLSEIRLPILWERLQPTLGGALDAGYVGIIRGLLDYAGGHGMKIILDLHNYGSYRGQKLGSGVSAAQFQDVWRRTAQTFGKNPGLGGYDLMNEPHDLAAGTWPRYAQAAVDAIRQVDRVTSIHVEGDAWSSAGSWTQANGALAIRDPSNAIIYSAHLYLDRDNSGTHFDWTSEAAAGVTVDTGAQRAANFISWLKAHNAKGEIGEIGAPGNDPRWLTALDRTIAVCQTAGVGVIAWAGGPWWGAYPLSVEPSGGRDAPQMAVLMKYDGLQTGSVTRASLFGVTTPGLVVQVSERNVVLGSAVADQRGVWRLTPVLSAGPHTLSATTSRDGVSNATSLRVTVRAVAPTAAAAARVQITPANVNPAMPQLIRSTAPSAAPSLSRLPSGLLGPSSALSVAAFKQAEAIQPAPSTAAIHASTLSTLSWLHGAPDLSGITPLPHAHA